MTTEENNTPEDNNTAPEGAIPPENAGDENIVDIGEAIEGAQASLNADDQITALQKELLDTRERTMRALADAENTRKRALKDRDDAGKYAVSNFARDLLDFGDNFKRAIDSMPDDTPTAVSDGLNAMEQELLNTFDRHGVKKITPLDEPFDANFHEVLFEVPGSGKQAGTIVQVIEPGYVLNGRLLRAAKVGIAKADDSNAGEHGIDTQA